MHLRMEINLCTHDYMQQPFHIYSETHKRDALWFLITLVKNPKAMFAFVIH